MARFASLVVALSLLPSCLIAQESDSTPFHHGQWAMQFGGNSNLFSLGVLRFTSAHAAWLLDLSNAANVISAKSTDNFGTTTSADQQYINLDVRLGKRFYQTAHPKVASFETLALEGGLTDQAFDLTGSHYRQTSTYAGIDGELGGAYMLTSGVSVGGTAIFSAGYLSFKGNDSFSRQQGHGYYNTIRLLVALGLYF
ncbi:MAG TPA: hypothetical protein VEK83_15235 [Gemmatimonadales bacterium]|nr:hypothetical protein [Gemmatimonadales bacterium]